MNIRRETTGRRRLLSAMAAGAVLVTAGYGWAETDTEWLKNAQLGPHASAKQDWGAIEAAARKEGKVVIYSVSSRIFELADKVKARFGIEVEAHDIPSDVQLEKFRREHKAGIYQVDVLFNNETPTILSDVLPRKLVWNFVPDSLADSLDDNEKAPLLVQRWSSRVIFYNTAKNPQGAPIDNLWDLTRPEWAGKLLMPDPLETSVDANVMQTILQHPKEMADAYQQEFGKPIEISDAVRKAVKKNAALGEATASMEWLYRLLKNKPVYLGSTTKLFNNMADVTQASPPLSLTTFSKMRSNKPGAFEAAPAFKVKPAFGVSYPAILTIADRAPHPNAAKVLIRYMMEEGFEPWNEPGDYAAVSGVEAKQVKEFGIPAYKDAALWPIDPNYVYDTKYTFLSLYMALK